MKQKQVFKLPTPKKWTPPPLITTDMGINDFPSLFKEGKNGGGARSNNGWANAAPLK